MALVALGLVPAIAQAQTAPNVTYKAPITITTGGTYTGNFRSTDSNVPCIKVSTTQPVIIEGCILAGAGNLITVDGGASVIVRNNRGYGIQQSQDNIVHGKFLGMIDGRSLTLEHNYFEHTTGITLYRWTGDGSDQQTIKVRYNQVRDIDGRYRNGGSEPWPSFLGLNQVRNTGNIDISFNEVINTPNQCATGDVINFYNSSGTSQSPMALHDNYVQGAYPYPANGKGYTGTGMTTDGDGTTAATITGFLNAFNNQFVSTCNAAMNIAAGHDIHYYGNRMVTSAYLPDGTAMPAVYAATAVFNGNGSPSNVFYNNKIDGNIIGYRSPGFNVPYTDRHDESAGACPTCSNNTHLPNPITLQTEANELTLWQQKVKQNNIILGPSTSSTSNAAPTVSLSAPSMGTVGRALTLSATATDTDGSISKVEFYNGATLLGQATASPYTLSYTPTTAGTLSLTARATDNAGAATSSAAVSLTVGVTAGLASPTDGLANASFYRAIDLGGAGGSIDGRLWEASSASGFSTNAPSWAAQAATLNPATDAARANMLRSALYGTGPTLALSVPSGTYGVYLYIWEDNNPETINIQVEGQTVRSGYSTGSAGHWERVGPFTASVTDGTLNVATSGGNVNLSGLEVWKANPNAAPTVSLNAASTGTVGRALTLSATATDTDGSISKVEFYNGATLLGQATASPYTLSYTPTTAGTLSLTARATDNAGVATSSAPISTTISTATTTAGGLANASFYRAIDLGGAGGSIDGRLWEASSASGFSTNAPSWAAQAATLNPATDAARANMLRSALYGTGPTLALSVPSGTYGVYLYIWEDNNPETINIQVEGQTVRSGYSTGSAGHWERVGPFTASVTDGTLNVATSGGNVNLSGLEVWKANTSASLSPGQGASFQPSWAALTPDAAPVASSAAAPMAAQPALPGSGQPTTETARQLLAIAPARPGTSVVVGKLPIAHL